MRSKTVLLVEDNPDDELLTLRAFTKNNIKNDIAVARDGAEALDYLFCEGVHAGRESELPELVLLDLKLPKIDGLEVLRRIRGDARTALLPVVVLTSSKDEEDLLRSYELGANSYVRKPVEFESFLDAVRNLGLYWLVLNEGPPRAS
jgi:two-component system response regulator